MCISRALCVCRDEESQRNGTVCHKMQCRNRLSNYMGTGLHIGIHQFITDKIIFTICADNLRSGIMIND